MKMNKTQRREILKFDLLSIMAAICAIFLSGIDTLNNISDEIYCCMLVISSVMSGFMFIGLEIFILLINNDRIKRFWNGHYLDSFYWSLISGFKACVTSAVLSFIILCTNVNAIAAILKRVDVFTMLMEFIYFIWSIMGTTKVLSIMKNTQF